MTSVAARNFTPSAPFDCHWQCTECGFQLPPIPAQVSPDSYRAPAEARPSDRRPEDPCPSCRRDDTWANLREGSSVEALIARDETRHATEGTRSTATIKLLCLGVWLAAVGIAVWGNAGWYLFPLAIGTAWMMAYATLAEFRAGRRAAMANSWSHQRFPGGRVRSSTLGPVSGPSPLRAPLTGRACLAYELGIRQDNDADGDPWTWTLLEQRCAKGIRVGNVEVEQNPHVLVEREVHVGELSPRAQRELRKRGIDPTRLGYTLFETVVVAGESAELQTRRGGLVLSTRTR